MKFRVEYTHTEYVVCLVEADTVEAAREIVESFDPMLRPDDFPEVIDQEGLGDDEVQRIENHETGEVLYIREAT